MRSDDDAAPDGGFSLVEVIVALTMLGIVMMASLAFVLNALNHTDGLGQRQAAAALADQAVEQTRSVPTAALTRGRTAAAVAALRTSGPTSVDTTIDDTTSAAAITATTDSSGSAVSVPLTRTATVASTPYTVKTFIEACWLASTASGGTTSQTCGPTGTGAARMTYRISVEVTWKRPGSAGCRGPSSTLCSYVLSTLRDATLRAATYQEPVFPVTLVPPTMSAPSPASVTAASTTTVSLSGTGFQVGATVSETGTGTVGTLTLTATSVSFPFTADTTSGVYQFQLTNPDGGTTSAVSITVTTSAPTITGLSGTAYPRGGTCRSPGYCTFVLSGSSYYTSSSGQKPVVTFAYNGGAPATAPNVTVVDAATLSAIIIPPYPGTTQVTIRVVDPDGGAVSAVLSITVWP